MNNDSGQIYSDIHAASKDYLQNYGSRRFYDSSNNRWCYIQQAEPCIVPEKFEQFCEFFSNTQISSPHIVQSYGVYPEDTSIFIVSALDEEYVTLRSLRYTPRPFELERALQETIFRNMVKALGDLHKGSIAHRWLTDAAFYTNPNGEVILSDWWHHQLFYSYDLRNCRIKYFMPERLAPEELRANGALSNEQGMQADVYALGVVGCYFLFGSFPYEDGSSASSKTGPDRVVEKLQAIFGQAKGNNSELDRKLPEATRRNLATCSSDIAEVLHRCLSIDTTKRYRSACEIDFS